MKVRISKILAAVAAGMLILGIVGCGAKSPTTANDITDGDQQKLTDVIGTATTGSDTELTVD